MKFFQIALLSLVTLCCSIFVSAPTAHSTTTNTASYKDIYTTILMAHDIDFSAATVQVLTKAQTIKWMQRNGTIRCPKQHAIDLKVIKAILKQDIIKVIRITNFKEKDGTFTELIVAFLPDGKLQQFDFSSYLVTNEACTGETILEEYCTYMYGYMLDATGGGTFDELNDRCPCMQESVPKSSGLCFGNCAEECTN